jgi:hypothetical protein
MGAWYEYRSKYNIYLYFSFLQVDDCCRLTGPCRRNHWRIHILAVGVLDQYPNLRYLHCWTHLSPPSLLRNLLTSVKDGSHRLPRNFSLCCFHNLTPLRLDHKWYCPSLEVCKCSCSLSHRSRRTACLCRYPVEGFQAPMVPVRTFCNRTANTGLFGALIHGPVL